MSEELINVSLDNIGAELAADGAEGGALVPLPPLEEEEVTMDVTHLEDAAGPVGEGGWPEELTAPATHEVYMELEGGEESEPQVQMEEAPDEAPEHKPPARIVPAKSAWMLYTHDMRPIIKAEQPGLKMTEQMKVISERWKALTDEERKPYEELAAKDKERFNREKSQASKQPAKAPRAVAMDVQGRVVGEEMVFPLARIRRSMKLDPEVKNVGKDPAMIVAKATELFLEVLAEQSAHILSATGKGRKTLKADDVASGMRRKQSLAFLRPDFPLTHTRKTPVAPKARAAAAESAPAGRDITSFFGRSN